MCHWFFESRDPQCPSKRSLTPLQTLLECICMFFLKKGKERVHTTGSHGQKPPLPSKRSHFTTGDGESDLNIVKQRDVHVEATDSIYDIPKSKLFVEDVGASEAHIDKDDVLGPSVKGFDSPKDFNIQGLTLPALAAVQVKIRTLVLHKCVTGDFGFSIRRVQFSSNKRGGVRTVVFAEPSEVQAGPPRPDDLKNRLLPGDQLIKIDGRSVHTMSREELQNAVRSAGDEIVLEVKSMPELAEFCDRKSRQSGVRDEGDQLMLGHINTTLYEDIPEDQRYWLVHKGGYTMVRLVEYLSDGRALVRIGAREMTVDSTDIDRMNPTHLDRVGDFASLRYLNETSAVHLLRQRFGSNLLYTNAGLSSVVCLASLEEDIVGEDRLVSLFKGCRRGQMPAHICATAQQIYRNLQMTGQDQCIVLTGVSGSGKTTQLRKLVRYFAEVAGWTHTLSYDKLALAMGVVEAFGHASSALHRDSTRFLYLFSLGFDKAAALRAGRFQVSLLEAERLGRVCGVEAAFHVFYYLWEGADGELRERLQLDLIEQPFIVPYSKKEDKQSAKEAWERLQHAFFELGLTQGQFDAVNSVLAAILHLQAAGCTPGYAQRAHFLRITHAQQAAALLGVSTGELGDALFRGKTNGNKAALKVASARCRMALTSRRSESSEALLSFCAGLYQELFYTVVELINKAMVSNSAFSWISVFDYPGSTFHVNWTERRDQRVLGLSDLVYNYINECVTELFYNTCFVDAQEVYSHEQVDVEVTLPIVSPCTLTRLLDQKQQLLACTDIDRRSEEKRGLFAILEEESLFPGATDESLLERFFIHLGDDSRMIRRASSPMQFVLEHAMSCYPTVYDVSGWVKQARPCESGASVRPLLLSSKSPAIISLFGSLLPNDASKLRRATQVAQLELNSRKSINGFFANIIVQLDYVFSTLRRSHRSYFVHCIQPSANLRSISSSHEMIDVSFVRSQIQSILLIDSVRVNNRGYPERVPFRDFRRRFGCLVEDELNSSINNALDDRAAVSRILERMDIHPSRYRLGISQVLLASDVMNELEDRRDFSLSGLVTAFQRECRKHLASKWLHHRRILETAIKCLQKNGKAYIRVREWPWWKLYTKIVPLLAATRSDLSHQECELRIRQLEQQLHLLRVEKTRQEGQIYDLEERLASEMQTTHELTQALNRETQTTAEINRRLQQCKDGALEDELVSRTSSVARLESDEKAAELKIELVRVQQAEEQMRAKTQHVVTQLRDVEVELNNIRARNETLEKKQQRFDADIEAVEKQLEEMKESKEKAEKERDELRITVSRKTGEVQDLKTTTSELRTAVARLQREAEERSDTVSNEELAALRREKRELENKLREQEEELDDLADTNHRLEQQITRLEMGTERLKSDLTHESTSKETELDEIRGHYQRRLRALEDQLDDLQGANSTLVKENRVLEARARQFDISRQSFEFSGGQYRRELRRVQALLADTQAVLAHERECAPSQLLLRQLRNQLEDAEAAKMSVLKSRHGLETELNEIRMKLEQTLLAKSAAEDRALFLLKEKNSSEALIEEKDEEYQQLMRKYNAAIQKTNLDHVAITDYMEQIAELEKAKQRLTEQLHEESSNAAFLSQHTVEKHKLVLCEQKVRNLETKLDLELAQKQRLDSIVIRLQDEVDALQQQVKEANCGREKECEALRKARKENMQLHETIGELEKRHLDSEHKKNASNVEIDRLEEANKILTAELKLAQRRIDSLQLALSEGLEGEDSDEENEDGHVFEDGRSAGINIL